MLPIPIHHRQHRPPKPPLQEPTQRQYKLQQQQSGKLRNQPTYAKNDHAALLTAAVLINSRTYTWYTLFPWPIVNGRVRIYCGYNKLFS